MNNAAKLANATVLNLISNKFEPQGVTAIALLAESHLSIHTWPEEHYSAVDIFTCGKNMKPDLSCKYLVQALMAGNSTTSPGDRPEPRQKPPFADFVSCKLLIATTLAPLWSLNGFSNLANCCFGMNSSSVTQAMFQKIFWRRWESVF